MLMCQNVVKEVMVREKLGTPVQELSCL